MNNKKRKLKISQIKLIEEDNYSINRDKTQNLLIEGDNIEVLSYLRKDYKNKIDVITIDPPYNTNIRLSYKDDYSSNNNTHKGWFDFIYPRLLLAYGLLSSTGVMYINIDDVEFPQLILICREIFGDENIDVIIWPKTNILFDQNRVEKPFNNIKVEHEYIVTCFKNKKTTTLNKIMIPEFVENHWIIKKSVLKSIIYNLGTTSSAKDELFEIFGEKKFQTPKPMKLIKELIRAASNQNSIILDFFAGSGTAGHAVLDLNEEDGGNRSFILINNDENNICREITYERLKIVLLNRFKFKGIKYLKASKL